jgi:integrase
MLLLCYITDICSEITSHYPIIPIRSWGKPWGKVMKLSVRKIKELAGPGRYSDGNGLYLHIRPGGSQQWLLRTTVQGKRTDIGLGSASLVTLSEAREKAHELRKQARDGLDPLQERRTLLSVPNFSEAAFIVWEQKRPAWKNTKHAKQWIGTLEEFAYPVIGEKKVPDVTSAHILEILSPIWTTKAETARRVRQRLRAVFDWAKVSGHRSGDNPVDGVKLALPKQADRVKHHAALPWQQLPEFMEKLLSQSGFSASALRFLILTATRSGEVRAASWGEIAGDIWCIPAERMKMKRDHRVPLSDAVLSVLEEMVGFSEILIFPSINDFNKPMSDMVFKALFTRMGYKEITAHGFRSTFRDWVSDNAVASREVAEAALAHQVGDKTERAYARSDMFERRRKLMLAWTDYALGTQGTTTGSYR